MAETQVTLPHLCILIASRNRPEELRRCLNSIHANTVGSYTVFVGFDDDRNGFDDVLPHPTLVKLLLPMRHYYVRAMQAVYEMAQEWCRQHETPFDWFCCLDDDNEIIARNWWASAHAFHLENFPDGAGIVDFDDPPLGGHFVSRKVCVDGQLAGHLGELCYWQFYADAERVERTKRASAIVTAHRSDELPLVAHHFNKGPAHYGALYRRRWDRWVFLERAKQFGWEVKLD